MSASAFLADFHIHSPYSRATSRELSLENLHRAALVKGIRVVGTGDFTHPAWMQEIREKLVPAEPGLFRLRDDLARGVIAEIPASCAGDVRFVLTSEISSIYKKNGRVRKVHNLLFAPGADAALKISGRLERIGNISSDGRPILGLDARELLSMVLDVSAACFVVPAHIWTPWFSVLGSNSGFDSIRECFDDLTDEIFALETGLSSDPAMNWRLSALDRFQLISNSDAHSPDKLGREANLFACGLSFEEIGRALRQGRDGGFLGTVEFFPEQGKYHFDGHRKCACRLHPAETLRSACLCPVCGRKVTVGVMHRVEVLADRPEGIELEGALPYDRLISLAEAVGEAEGQGAGSKRVQQICRRLVQELGPEISILSRVELSEIRRVGGSVLAEGIRRMRAAEVIIEEGYDGEFGVVRLFRPDEREEWKGQACLIALPGQSELGASAGQGARRARKSRTGAASLQGPPGPPQPGMAEEDGLEPPRTFDDRSGGEPDRICAEESSGSDYRPLGSPGKCAGDEIAPTDLLTEGVALESRGLRGDGQHKPAGLLAKGDSPEPQTTRRSPWSLELLERLNPAQQEAVLSFGAPLLLIAGPGTGKTLTLTYRIAYQVRELGMAADRILAVTFTQRAAREMEERLIALLGGDGEAPRVRVRTFHAVGAEILGEAGPDRGVPAGFRILGEEEQLQILRRAAPGFSSRDREVLLERISAAKRSLRYPGQGEELAEDIDFLSAWRAYQQLLTEYRSVDYDDLVSLPVRILESDPGFRHEVQGRIQAVSVDEYQDVNHSQYRLLKLISGQARDLCVIGDPDQAIYGFRGASPRYFLEFELDYPGGRVLRLEHNYRSTAPILTAAAHMLSAGGSAQPAPVAAFGSMPEIRTPALSVPGSASDSTGGGEVTAPVLLAGDGEQPKRIAAAGTIRELQTPSGGRTEGRLIATLGTGPKIREAELASDKAEAIFIAQTIESLMGGTDSLSLYADKVADEAEARCASFAEIAVLYRLQALAPGLESALRHQGIPFQGASHAACWQGREGRTLLAVLKCLHDPEDRLAWETLQAGLRAGAEELRAGILRFREVSVKSRRSLKECMLGLAQLPSIPFQESPWKEMQERLLRASMAFGRNDWPSFLRSLCLSRVPDFLDLKSERVTLATLHSAKGLEFPVVFIAGCEDPLLPCRLGPEVTDPEEERRLFYVGMTRACRLLILTRARSRFLYGERRECGPSFFLKEIPPDLVEKVRLPAQRIRKKPQDAQLPLFGSTKET